MLDSDCSFFGVRPPGRSGDLSLVDQVGRVEAIGSAIRALELKRAFVGGLQRSGVSPVTHKLGAMLGAFFVFLACLSLLCSSDRHPSYM